MSDLHSACLSLGSNIQPEANMVRAIELLSDYGTLEKISSAWESAPAGATGPNYLNACALFQTHFSRSKLKDQVLLPIEAQLGRRRGPDKFAPRTMDIDIVLFDGRSCGDKFWGQAFVVVPLAEILPAYRNPVTGEDIAESAARLRQRLWMAPRPGVFQKFAGGGQSG